MNDRFYKYDHEACCYNGASGDYFCPSISSTSRRQKLKNCDHASLNKCHKNEILAQQQQCDEFFMYRRLYKDENYTIKWEEVSSNFSR